MTGSYGLKWGNHGLECKLALHIADSFFHPASCMHLEARLNTCPSGRENGSKRRRPQVVGIILHGQSRLHHLQYRCHRSYCTGNCSHFFQSSWISSTAGQSEADRQANTRHSFHRAAALSIRSSSFGTLLPHHPASSLFFLPSYIT